MWITSGNILVLEHCMHGILCISGKLHRPWTCDLVHYFCHLFQDWSVFFVVFLNFHFFAKVWSLKLLAKNFATDVNTLAKVLRMSSARRNCDQKSLRKKGAHCVCAREISDWLIPSLHQLFTCLAAEVRYLTDIL
jgi:hypothetical protein